MVDPDPGLAPLPLHRQQQVTAIRSLVPDRFEKAYCEAIGIVRSRPQGIAAGDGGQRMDRDPAVAQVERHGGADGGPAALSRQPGRACPGRWRPAPAGHPAVPQAVQGDVAQALLFGIGRRHPGAQLDRVVQAGDLAAALGRGGGVAEPERQAVEVGSEAEQVDPAAVGLGVAAGRVEFAPEGPGAPERIAGQGGVELTDGDGRRLQRRDDPAGDEQVSHPSFRTGMLSPSNLPLIMHFLFNTAACLFYQLKKHLY